ncbi:MAG: CBS domain-containing protein [Ruminococcaceae bacterium]|nr:CBS domain-containing protein [Oscillospiraceae bacterium]
MNVAFFLTPKNNVAYLTMGDSMRQGLEKLRRHGYTALPVIYENGKYAGFISEGDFLRSLFNIGTIDMRDLEAITIDEAVHKEDFSVRITASMDDLVSNILDHNFVPVVDDRGMFMGIVTRHAVIKYFAKKKA